MLAPREGAVCGKQNGTSELQFMSHVKTFEFCGALRWHYESPSVRRRKKKSQREPTAIRWVIGKHQQVCHPTNTLRDPKPEIWSNTTWTPTTSCVFFSERYMAHLFLEDSFKMSSVANSSNQSFVTTGNAQHYSHKWCEGNYASTSHSSDYIFHALCISNARF